MRLFIVEAFREPGYTTLSVDIAKRFLVSKAYTDEDASAAATAAMTDLPADGVNVGMT